MSDLSFSMLLRLMDGWSGPADKVRNSMRRLSQSAKTMQRDLGRKVKTGFSEAQLEAALTRSETRISKHRQRLLGAGAMAVTLGAPVIQAGNYQERLIDFANLAEIGEERVKKLDAQLDALRKTTGQSKLDVLLGLEAYVGKGMGLDEALAGMEATGKAAKAYRSAMGEMANSGFAVMDNLGVDPERLRQAFDIMAKSGKEGSFELGAMARKFPEITAGAKSLKMEGVDSVASLSAALQIAMKAAGSEDQAATNMTNFLGKITAPDTVKKFRDFGVNVEKEMKIALERGADPLEHMLLVIREMTGGDAFKMGELFADKQVLDFLRAMIPNMEEYQRIKQEALGADGVVDKDFEKVMKGFNEEWRQLKNSVASLTTKSGVLLPIFTDIMSQMRMGVETVAEWTAANPELTETLVKGTAALLAFGVGARVISFGLAVMGGGLLRTASLFFKFNKAGKNVSLVARSYRTLARLMRSPLKWALTPLRWTTSIIPAIRWGALAGTLKWSKLITPLMWAGRAGLRFIPGIGWAALAGELMWKLLIKPLGWDKYIPDIDWSHWFSFNWLDKLPEWDWGAIIPDLDFWGGGEPKGPRPIRSQSDLLADREAVSNEIAALQARIAQIKDGPLAATLRQPLREELLLLQAELAPITQAINRGREQGLAGPGLGNPSAQTGVSIQNNPQLDVKVSLDMPISITRDQQISNQELAKQAGQRVGAETERAIRRGLDDAALAE